MNEQQHTLVTTETGGYTCTTCEWRWKHVPREACPGVKRYAYGQVPATLVTFTELRRRHLKPGGPPAGAYRRARSPYEYLYFYDLAKAQRRRTATEKQREALAKARAARKDQHTCKRCGYYDDSHGTSHWKRRVTVLKVGGEQQRYCAWCRDYLIWVYDRQVLEHHMRELTEQDEREFLVLDTETTGLPEHAHFQVVEIGMVDKRGTVIYHSLVRPDIPMPTGASLVNGITDDALKDAPTFPELWPALVALLGTHDLYCYNAEFDREAIFSTAARYGLEVPRPVQDDQRWQCMMRAYAMYHGEWSDYWHDWKWQSLDVACEELGVAGNDFHRAVGDALNCLGVMRALAARADASPAQEAFPNEAP